MTTRRTPEQWANLIDQWQHCDLPITRFCLQHRISPASFYKWRKKLSAQNEGRFLPVVVTASAEPVYIQFSGGARIEVHETSNPVALQLAVAALR